ncbi:hypothetical protein ACNHYB_03710 [Isoptericola jiangsuensis]|uniref:MmyB family transcriptional regulator n=1 Tax=Isoptericola jiangsuensis TaxID=548579 RepID=UPI003AAF5761
MTHRRSPRRRRDAWGFVVSGHASVRLDEPASRRRAPGRARRRWARHDVRRHTRGRKLIEHPEVGRLDLEYNDFALPRDPHITIPTYTAAPASSSADGLALLAAWAGTEANEAHPIDQPSADRGGR